MLELDVTLQVIVACVDFIAELTRDRLRVVCQFVAFQIMFARERLFAGGVIASERTVVKMLVPNMVVQMIKPPPVHIFGYIIVGTELFCYPLKAALAD